MTDWRLESLTTPRFYLAFAGRQCCFYNTQHNVLLLANFKQENKTETEFKRLYDSLCLTKMDPKLANILVTALSCLFNQK